MKVVTCVLSYPSPVSVVGCAFVRNVCARMYDGSGWCSMCSLSVPLLWDVEISTHPEACSAVHIYYRVWYVSQMARK